MTLIPVGPYTAYFDGEPIGLVEFNPQEQRFLSLEESLEKIMAKAKKITKAEQLVEAFDAAAQNHGWQRDQGWGSNVIRAEDAYLETRKTLVKYVEALERQVKRLKGNKHG